MRVTADVACVVKRLAVVAVAVVCGEAACQEPAPTLRLHVDGVANPSMIRVEYMLSGPFGGYRNQVRASARDIDIPIAVEGRSARSLKAIVFCPGYHTARLEIPDVAAQTELRVALDALPVRRVNGKVEFVGGAKPRGFVLEIDVMVPSTHQFFGIADGAATTFDIAEAMVSAQGDFSAVIADLGRDVGLQALDRSGVVPSVFLLHARDAATRNFVFDLTPREIAIEGFPRALVLSASPAPR
jgi:hypothetical protein